MGINSGFKGLKQDYTNFTKILEAPQNSRRHRRWHEAGSIL